MTTAAPHNPKSAEAEPIIALENVHFTYPGYANEALRGVTFSVQRGEYLCILGGNGSGKSTVTQLVNALLAPTKGCVRVFGLNSLEAGNAFAIRRRTAMVFQHPEDQMVTSIVADDVAFGPENLGVPQPEIARRVNDALAAVGMSGRAQADPADLSGGQKQRVAIAGALAMKPEILLLDEPSAMLDTEGRRAIQDIIAQLLTRGITIVHITHFMDDALRADRVIVMEHGRVALDGTPREVFADRERVRTLGLEMPFALQLSEKLNAHGFSLPMTADVDELAGFVASELTQTRHSRTFPSANPPFTDIFPAKTAEICTSMAGLQGKAAANDGFAGDASSTAPLKRTNAEPAIVFDHVSFSYAHAASARKRKRHGLFGNHTRPTRPEELAIQDLSFTVKTGSLTALIGHTGSGKSTTVELACALKVPLTGTVHIAGIDTDDLDRRRELRRTIGYVSQLPERQLFAETVREDIAFGPRNLGLSDEEIETRICEALTSVGLPADDAFLARSPFALSGGQQRGVALAGILAMRPRIIVLDEPMAGLDPAGRAQTRALLTRLKREGITLLLVTHNMDDVAELADHVIALDNGHVVADGTPAEVFGAEVHKTAAEAAANASLAALGLPSALAFARALEAHGTALPSDPLTLDELVNLLAQEVTRHGTAR